MRKRIFTEENARGSLKVINVCYSEILVCIGCSLYDAVYFRLHTGDASYACIDCGEAFKGKAELLQHCKMAHPNLNVNIQSGNSTSVSQQSSTVTHNSTQDLKPHILSVAGRQKSNVQVFKNIHIFLITERIFTIDGLILQTINVEMQDKPGGYTCQECGNCFNTKVF